MQAAALKPADFFGNDDVLYLMEDMATGEIRLSILWEWLHKSARVHRGRRRRRREGGRRVHRPISSAGCSTEEYDKLQRAGNRDVHDNSKTTTLPIAREIADVYVLGDRKLPWYIDLLNINLGVHTWQRRSGGFSCWSIRSAIRARASPTTSTSTRRRRCGNLIDVC